jgi:hypothetical protein
LIVEAPTEPPAMCITRKDDPCQHHFNGGIAAAFPAEVASTWNSFHIPVENHVVPALVGKKQCFDRSVLFIQASLKMARNPGAEGWIWV